MNRSAGSLPKLSPSEFLKWIFRLRKRLRVLGASMYPILKPGDEVLIDRRAYLFRAPKIGEIVVAIHPRQPGLKIVKRVAGVTPDGRYNLEGENPFESTDFRGVPAGTILGRVTCIFSQGSPAAAPKKED